MAGQLTRRFEENKIYRFPDVQTKRFITLLGGNRYERSCDIGCGRGYWSYILAKYNLVKNEICGCDLHNDYRMDEIKSVNPDPIIRYADIKDDSLPFSDEMFDLVFSVDVVEHVKDEKLFFLEHLRIAKAGATILIVTPNYWRLGNIVLMAINRLKYPRRMGEGSSREMVHITEYSSDKLLELAGSASDMIKIDTLRIIPCWVGVPLTNIGRDRIPGLLEKFCHSLFMVFKKR